MDVNEAKSAHEDELLAAPGVVGVGVGCEGGEDVIFVFVEQLTPENDVPEKLGLPARVEDFSLVMREIGSVKALG